MLFRLSVAFSPVFRLSATFHCLLGVFRFSAAFQISFPVSTVFKNSFQKQFSAFRRYFQLLRFSMTQKCHFSVCGTLLFPVFRRIILLFRVFRHFLGAFTPFRYKYNAPSYMTGYYWILINICYYSPTCMLSRGSGTPLVRLYKDNAYFLGHLPQSAHLTNFGGLRM